jgi:hypothetical protein
VVCFVWFRILGFVIFKIRSYYVAPASAFPSAGIIGMHHHAQLKGHNYFVSKEL